MHNIHIAGTGLWYPEEKISNEELVNTTIHTLKNSILKINQKSMMAVSFRWSTRLLNL